MRAGDFNANTLLWEFNVLTTVMAGGKEEPLVAHNIAALDKTFKVQTREN
jgi:hypothetical protein